MADCYGTVRWLGRVAAHAGPYSVTLDCGVTGSTSLLARPGQQATTLFERLVQQILGLE